MRIFTIYSLSIFSNKQYSIVNYSYRVVHYIPRTSRRGTTLGISSSSHKRWCDCEGVKKLSSQERGFCCVLTLGQSAMNVWAFGPGAVPISVFISQNGLWGKKLGSNNELGVDARKDVWERKLGEPINGVFMSALWDWAIGCALARDPQPRGKEIGLFKSQVSFLI